MIDDILTTEQVAKYLKVSTRTVDRQISKHGLPCGFVGKKRRFSKRQVLEWLESGAEDRLHQRQLIDAVIKRKINRR